jgi:hypothetical protein
MSRRQEQARQYLRDAVIAFAVTAALAFTTFAVWPPSRTFAAQLGNEL